MSPPADLPAPLRRAAALVLVALVPLLSAAQLPQDRPTEAAVKAAFLFRFAAFVTWPEGAEARDSIQFAIVGDAEIAEELRRRLPGRSVAGRAAVVREHARLEDAGGAHVLYVGRGQVRRLRQVAPRLDGALTVTDDPGGLAAGAVINFLREGDRVRFEVSLDAAERAGLRLRAGLLSVAARVEGHVERP